MAAILFPYGLVAYNVPDELIHNRKQSLFSVLHESLVSGVGLLRAAGCTRALVMSRACLCSMSAVILRTTLP